MIGNIKQKTYYAYTTGTPTGGTAITYGYDTVWKDKLTSYNGKAITYDAIGNPLTYDGWTYTWQTGRQLAKMQKTGMTVEFKYNHSGLRTQKKVTANGVTTTTDYTLHGKLITHLTKGNDVLHFFYDAQSKPAMVEYNGAMYRYVHNLQGDIVGILDSAGSLVVEYKYDAWGNPIATTGNLKTSLGELNPFRYRGYVWDGDINLYHLRSRMMSSEMMRFISFDGAVESSIKTIFREQSSFRYCYNAPTAYFDCDGNIALTLGCAFLAMTVGGIASVASGLISSLFTEDTPTWGSVANDFVKGASVTGATICYGPLGGAAMAGTFAAAEYAYECAEGESSPTLDGLKDAVVTDSITQLVLGGTPAVPTSISAVKELAVDTVVGTFKEDVVSTTVQLVSNTLEGANNNSGAKTVRTSSTSKPSKVQTSFGSTMPYLKTVRDTPTGKLKEVVVYP